MADRPKIQAKVKRVLSEEEKNLAAILMDASGLDIAEFLWTNKAKRDLCYRAYPYQWTWFRRMDPRSIDQAGRSVGKCLLKGTLLLTEDGLRPIEGLVGKTPLIAAPIGWAVSMRRARSIYPSGVKSIRRVETASGKTLAASLDHRLWTSEGWFTIGGLKSGDEIATSDGDSLIWDEIVDTRDDGVGETYDVEMEGAPSFIADGMVVHNSERINQRVHAFPFSYPGQEMVLVAPESKHIETLAKRIENRLKGSRLMREMLAGGGTRGITHRPFAVDFLNGAHFITRLPLRDGLGLKGIHPTALHVDEAQDLTEAAYKELPEVVDFSIDGAYWMCHGVSKGVRDSFWEKTQPGSGFHVNRIMAMSRPDWTPEARAQRVRDYITEESPDFKRNVYGVHGDSMNRIFLLNIYMRGVVDEADDEYNTDEYFRAKIHGDEIARRVGTDVEASTPAHTAAILSMLPFPEPVRQKYGRFWVGMDVGRVSDPSEILVFAEYYPSVAERNKDIKRHLNTPAEGVTRFKLVTRIQMKEVPTPLTVDVICAVIDFYKPRAFTLDRGGLGRPYLDELQKRAGSARFYVTEDPDEDVQKAITVIKGYTFSDKLLSRIDDELVAKLRPGASPQEIIEKAGVKENAKDLSTDELRELVHGRRMIFPADDEVTKDMNGQTEVPKTEMDPYGNSGRSYSKGAFHILDAARFMALGWRQAPIERFVEEAKPKSSGLVLGF